MNEINWRQDASLKNENERKIEGLQTALKQAEQELAAAKDLTPFRKDRTKMIVTAAPLFALALVDIFIGVAIGSRTMIIWFSFGAVFMGAILAAIVFSDPRKAQQKKVEEAQKKVNYYTSLIQNERTNLAWAKMDAIMKRK